MSKAPMDEGVVPIDNFYPDRLGRAELCFSTFPRNHQLGLFHLFSERDGFFEAEGHLISGVEIKVANTNGLVVEYPGTTIVSLTNGSISLFCELEGSCKG